jgi:hypothetical protein
MSILFFEPVKLALLRKRVRRISAVILTEQAPNLGMGDFAGQYTLADPVSGEPLRVAGVNIIVLELQIRMLESTWPGTRSTCR